MCKASSLARTPSWQPSVADQQRKGCTPAEPCKKHNAGSVTRVLAGGLAECPFKSLPGIMAPMARLQQLATSNISKYPQEASPDRGAGAPKGSLDRLSVADQVREILMRVCTYMSCRWRDV